MNDDYGDPDTDLDAAMLDHMLRGVLNDIPADYAGPVADVAAHVQQALAAAWPDGQPPTAEELGSDAAYFDATGEAQLHGDAHDHPGSGQHGGHPDATAHWPHHPGHDGDFGGGHFSTGHDLHGGGFDPHHSGG